MLRWLSNILWFLLGGLWLGILWCFAGGILCITILGIPLGLQCFKAARLSFFPFGKSVELHFLAHPIANVIWVFLGGWEMMLVYFFVGVLNCITILGIPNGIQCFKMMKLAIFPFGAKITRR